MSDILSLSALNRASLEAILELSSREDLGRPLSGKGVALLFQKPSSRTRNATEMAVVGLGGHPVYITDAEVGLGSGRESPPDIARTLACYHTIVAARVFEHEVLEAMASAIEVPMLNLLSDRAHPLQALADLLTLRERFGRLEGLRLAYVGDGANVARSLAVGCIRLGVEMTIAAPEGYQLELDEAAGLRRTADPEEAVAGAQAVYTDSWVSMGQEAEAETRRAAFKSYQVNAALMRRAAADAVFLHCLPAHRGAEVTDEVIDAPSSLVWTQARNRMRTARGALAWMAGVRP